MRPSTITALVSADVTRVSIVGSRRSGVVVGIRWLCRCRIVGVVLITPHSTESEDSRLVPEGMQIPSFLLSNLRFRLVSIQPVVSEDSALWSRGGIVRSLVVILKDV